MKEFPRIHAGPVFFHVEGLLGGRHGSDALCGVSQYAAGLVAPRFPRGRIDEPVQHCHVVFNAVIEFIEEDLLVRLGSLSVTDVDKHVNRPDQFTVLVKHRCRKRQERHHCAVRPLRNRFNSAHGSFLAERNCHRTLIVGKRLPIRCEQAIGHAPFVLAHDRLPPGEFGGGPVVVSDLSLRVRGVDGRRKRLQDLAHFLFFSSELSSQLYRVSDIDCETPGIEKFAIAKLDTRGDFYVSNGAVFRAQPGGKAVQLFST